VREWLTEHRNVYSRTPPTSRSCRNQKRGSRKSQTDKRKKLQHPERRRRIAVLLERSPLEECENYEKSKEYQGTSDQASPKRTSTKCKEKISMANKNKMNELTHQGAKG